MNTAPKLEPCPFCGGTNIKMTSKPRPSREVHACMSCGAEAANWNRRAAPSAGLREALAELVAARKAVGKACMSGTDKAQAATLQW